VSILVTAASTESDEAGEGAFPFPPTSKTEVRVANIPIGVVKNEPFILHGKSYKEKSHLSLSRTRCTYDFVLTRMFVPCNLL